MEEAALAHWQEVIKDTALRAVRLPLPTNVATAAATVVVDHSEREPGAP